MIRELNEIREFQQCTQVIREAFSTVAEDFSLTRDNAPSNPAFIETDAVIRSYDKGIKYFGLFDNNELIGCIAVEKAGDQEGTFYFERLAVLPRYRHSGFGRNLMDYACDYVKDKGGNRVSIGIINEHMVIKQWYKDYGFNETGIKEFEHLPFSVCFMEMTL